MLNFHAFFVIKYSVESVLLRITKPLNYVLIAPSRQQVAEQV
jgi:hypothetical protein